MDKPDIDSLQKEIADAEKNFCHLAADSGIAYAFEYYAADDAVLLRGDNLIKGKKAIIKSLRRQASPEGILIWEPDFIDVSRSGDMAYTYGKFNYTTVSPAGDTIISNGIFHTIWKKQADGSWKYVWD